MNAPGGLAVPTKSHWIGVSLAYHAMNLDLIPRSLSPSCQFAGKFCKFLHESYIGYLLNFYENFQPFDNSEGFLSKRRGIDIACNKSTYLYFLKDYFFN